MGVGVWGWPGGCEHVGMGVGVRVRGFYCGASWGQARVEVGCGEWCRV